MILVTQQTDHNLSKARQFGEIAGFVSNKDYPAWGDPQEFKDSLRRTALEFDPDKDHLLLVGDPIVIALCIHTLLTRFGSITVLKFDRQTYSYIPIPLSI